MRLKILFFLLIFSFSVIILPGQVLASSATVNLTKLSDKINADLVSMGDDGHVSLYYFDLGSGDSFSIDPDRIWPAASMLKLYVAMYAFDQAARGKFSLDKTVVIDVQNVAPVAPVPNGYPPLVSGQVVSVRELIERMITQSGNTSYNTLLDIFDRREVTKYIQSLGLVNSSVGAKLNLNDVSERLDEVVPGYGSNTTTALDFGRAFVLIAQNKVPGAANLFDILSRQKLNSMIPVPLPPSAVVAHKTGELDPYYHDGGIIVDGQRRYVLSIFTDAGDPSLVTHISDLVYRDAPITLAPTPTPFAVVPNESQLLKNEPPLLTLWHSLLTFLQRLLKGVK